MGRERLRQWRERKILRENRPMRTQEFVKMVAETELMVSGVAKERSEITFVGPNMHVQVRMGDGHELNVSSIDYRVLTPDDVKGMVRMLMCRIVELATTPRG